MFNYYIKESAYENIGIDVLELNLKELNDIVINKANFKYDNFYKSDNIWSTIIDVNLLFGDAVFSNLRDKQFECQVVPKLLQQIKNHKTIDDIDSFNKEFKDQLNAFFGAVFKDKLVYCISNINEFLAFKELSLTNSITPVNFWERKNLLFTKINFCGEVREQIEEIGFSKEFQQIINRLKELDNFNKKWASGNFSIEQLNKETNLKASPESDSVRNNSKLKNQRMFKLPNGEIKYFEMHIKTGNLRFHFYPNPENHIIYIGYIGKHLAL